ncbi:hypothetical protein ACFWVC_00760 [Streptomyces sp. NPDC058691]|uniref:hypothetical protein n=1 Tax=Streptomyces sp. NPDC058691 TaxID=3346601 RepID=UPI00366686EF
MRDKDFQAVAVLVLVDDRLDALGDTRVGVGDPIGRADRLVVGRCNEVRFGGRAVVLTVIAGAPTHPSRRDYVRPAQEVKRDPFSKIPVYDPDA